jgi:hypothetical protein
MGEKDENGDWRVTPVVFNGIELTGPGIMVDRLICYAASMVSQETLSDVTLTVTYQSPNGTPITTTVEHTLEVI